MDYQPNINTVHVINVVIFTHLAGHARVKFLSVYLLLHLMCPSAHGGCHMHLEFSVLNNLRIFRFLALAVST